MLLPIIALVLGVILGQLTSINIPPALSPYMSVALLAALDSVLGGVRATLENKFDDLIFFSGLLSNALLAGALAFLGDQLGVNLYMAAIFAFGVRLFQNLALIRRLLIDKWYRQRK
ncbi:MAG: small basic family protein [Firmicutes bacterium]|nr:small basic family protein [Bacillota bacterium]